MGRKDAVQFTLEWAARARSYGAVVTFQSGWESRGNGTSADYEGAIVHHTASNSSAARPNPTLSLLISGRSDLSGPLCNVTGPWCTTDAPKLHVVAAHPANHAGASGGRSMGPLPVTGLFNKRVYGLEIDYAGSSAMTDGQRRAALIFARSVADVLGRSTEYVRAHAESSITGKWDPGYASGKTIDMGAFRRDAAALAPGGDDMPLSDADVAKVWAYGIGAAGGVGPAPAFAWMQHAAVHATAAAAMRFPFMGFRNDPEQTDPNTGKKGDGSMVLAAPGYWVGVPATPYIGLYQNLGLVGSFVNLPGNQFWHFRDVFLAPISGNVDNGKLAEALKKTVTEAEALQTAELLKEIGARVSHVPAEVVPAAGKTAPLTTDQLQQLAALIAPALAPHIADQWDSRARDNDPKTGPVT